MKTGINKLNQLQVVVALLALGPFGRVRVGSGGRPYRGTSPGERLSARKFHGHALAGKHPRMTSK